jgi:hypothetical protein
MSEPHDVAVQPGEDNWTALRRIVVQEITDYDECAAEYERRIVTNTDTDGQAATGAPRCRAKADAAKAILRCMDTLIDGRQPRRKWRR